jgi:hypothetical protein
MDKGSSRTARDQGNECMLGLKKAATVKTLHTRKEIKLIVIALLFFQVFGGVLEGGQCCISDAMRSRQSEPGETRFSSGNYESGASCPELLALICFPFNSDRRRCATGDCREQSTSIFGVLGQDTANKILSIARTGISRTMPEWEPSAPGMHVFGNPSEFDPTHASLGTVFLLI